MRRNIFVLVACAALAACGAAEPSWAPDEAVAKARYVHKGPTAVTLFTVISTGNGSGAHSGLMINGSQRVMFDPAGSWSLPALAERNDVHFGITEKMVSFYIDYHARETYDVVEQTVVVTPEVAELVMKRAMAYGAVPKAHCTDSISSILRGVPGFETLPATMFPKSLMKAFGTLPGVKERTITDDDADDNHGVLLLQRNDPRFNETAERQRKETAAKKQQALKAEAALEAKAAKAKAGEAEAAELKATEAEAAATEAATPAVDASAVDTPAEPATAVEAAPAPVILLPAGTTPEASAAETKAPETGAATGSATEAPKP